MKSILVLGCEGQQHNGFYLCHSVKNTILDLESIERSDDHFAVIKYLDQVVKIFDSPCNKYNVITNAIYKLYQMDIINEELYQSISYFYKIHAKCSLILTCEVKG